MADQGKWFKLWCSAGDDPDIANLSLEDFGRWCRLGMYIKLHGTNGTVSIQKPAYSLQQQFRVSSCEDVLQILSQFPNCNTVSLGTNITVSFRNWLKYQGDFSSDRVRKFREMKRSKRRGEEKRQEEKRTTPLPPVGDKGNFGKFWQAYPRHKSRTTAERAFAKACTGGATLAMMLDALKRLVPEWASRPPDKIPYPATWLNAKGWEDEVTIGIGSQIIAAPKDECGRCGYGRTLHLRLLDGPNKGKIMGHTHGVSKVCEEYQSC